MTGTPKEIVRALMNDLPKRLKVRVKSEEGQRGWSEAFHLSSPSTNLTSGLAARRLFRVPPCCAGTIHLQTSMSSLEFEPRPYGTAVSVANHYTGWATIEQNHDIKWSLIFIHYH
ncbi:hypothetical protein TNCV_2704661 [Trichonephila clavipes]|nr:hypothetical protein TNCV_2704661 [Trichonephila clavipes]